MITPNDEKKMLIQSMKKLTSHVAGSEQRQKDIFEALSLNDFNKIISNLQDQNQYLRRISALFLCEMFYRNGTTRRGAARLLGLQPEWGRVCLGGVPTSVCRFPSTLKKCVELMRSKAQEDQESKMCWMINLERKTLRVQSLQYKKYSSFTFIDPAKHIFGFTINNPSKPVQIIKQPNLVDDRAKEKSSDHFFKRSVDYYNKKVSNQQSKSKDKDLVTKKNLNNTITLQSERRQSMTSGGSNQVKNQLGSSHYKPDHSKTMELKKISGTELKNISGTQPLKEKQSQSRISKQLFGFSPKISHTQPNKPLFPSKKTNSQQLSTIQTDRSYYPREQISLITPLSTRASTTHAIDKFSPRVHVFGDK